MNHPLQHTFSRFSVLLACLLGIASVAFGEGHMQVTVCPRLTPAALGETNFVEQVEDLFINQTNEWDDVLSQISHFKFYSTPVTWLKNNEPALAAMGKAFAVEVGIRKGHENTEDNIFDPITAAGGTVDFVIMKDSSSWR